MRILYILFNTKKNGGNKVILDQISQLTSIGQRVEIVTVFGGTFDWYDKKITSQKLSARCFRNKYDYIVSTFWPTAYIGLFLRATKKYYFIQALEDNFSNRLIYKLLVRLTYKLPYTFLVTTQFLKKSLVSYGLSEHTISIADSISVDPLFFKKKHSRINPKKIRILTVMSRYLPYKGPDIYLKTLQNLKQHYPVHATLVSMERHPLSPLVDTFISNPSVKQLSNLYLSHDILLVPSRSEGFFLPGLEAMAAGCLVITTDNGGILTYAKHNYNAIILSDFDQLMKENIVDTLLRDHKLVDKIRSNAYKTAEQYRTNHTPDALKKLFSL